MRGKKRRKKGQHDKRISLNNHQLGWRFVLSRLRSGAQRKHWEPIVAQR